ncbi:MAG: hydantoinase/oxoprolinase N-terminal domain-containing protein [Geminicoccaceae bacterium]
MTKIGIDVGGTNTDAVLLEDTLVLAAVKTPTTEDVTTGIRTALDLLLGQSAADPAAVDSVMIGTTHFTNAVIQRRSLQRIAAVRVGLPASASLPPFCDWPEDLAGIVDGGHHMIRGGHEYDGRPIVPFDAGAMREIAEKIRDSGIRSVAISAIFSPLTAAAEEQAAGILREVDPQIALTLSHELGRLGLLERENVTLLNAALLDLAGRTTDAFVRALAESGIKAPLYLTQNDGTIVNAAYAARVPVYSFASGPTNSMRGANFLSSLEDAIVADVGGTTTDVGCLRLGFPREANNVVEIGGVRTNFRMPDVLSIGLGGGSIVAEEPLAVGPLSVGYELTRKARVFGGDVLTATDLAVAAGRIALGDPSRVADLDPGLVERAMARIGAMIAEAVDRMKPDARPIPLIAVGGGAFLIPDALPGISEVVKVPHSDVANAVGAAIAQISGEVDQIFHDLPREEAIAGARALAEAKAIAAGAEPATLKVVEVEDLPLAYLPGNALRTRVRVVGDVAASGGMD